MSNKHTPGPWLVTGGTFVYALNDYGTNSFWANIYAGSQGGYKSAATSSEEIEANANLIAAAPRMLSDLVEVARLLREYEKLHRAKGEDGHIKAERNKAWAEQLEATISSARG